jgi:hypothetical protein
MQLNFDQFQELVYLDCYDVSFEFFLAEVMYTKSILLLKAIQNSICPPQEVKVTGRRRSLFLAFLDSLLLVAFLKQSLKMLQAASSIVAECHCASGKGCADNMPLTRKVSFKTMLQRGNRVQVPKVVRWQFKMDSEQVLKVTVNALNVFSGWETFYARMGKDGRITLPRLMRELLRGREQSLTGYVMEVILEPAEE